MGNNYLVGGLFGLWYLVGLWLVPLAYKVWSGRGPIRRSDAEQLVGVYLLSPVLALAAVFMAVIAAFCWVVEQGSHKAFTLWMRLVGEKVAEEVKAQPAFADWAASGQAKAVSVPILSAPQYDEHEVPVGRERSAATDDVPTMRI